jgi:acetyl esterase
MSDPEVDALLEELIAAARPSSMSLPLPEGRRNFEELFTGLSSRPEVGASVDRKIPGTTVPQTLRIYTPARFADDGESVGPRPLVLAFHGGGWVFGNIRTFDALCRGLANASRSIVVSLEYRLAPEHPFPAALDDAATALEWASDHAAELGSRADRIALAGESSGGTLAAALTLRVRNDGGPPIAFELLLYPSLDTTMSTPSYRENADDPFLSAAEMTWYWTRYLGTDAPTRITDPYASPAHAPSLEGLPPAHVITAGNDVLRDEGEAYAARLRTAGVPATMRRYADMPHGFMSFDAKLRVGAQAIADAGNVLRAALADPVPEVADGRSDGR